VSVERFTNPSGETVWRVRWREAGRNRSKVLGRKADAIAFDADVRRRKRTGELGLMEASRQTLDAFAAEWLEVYGRAQPRDEHAEDLRGRLGSAHLTAAGQLRAAPPVGGGLPALRCGARR
jgi:hypothetical protein